MPGIVSHKAGIKSMYSCLTMTFRLSLSYAKRMSIFQSDPTFGGFELCFGAPYSSQGDSLLCFRKPLRTL